LKFSPERIRVKRIAKQSKTKQTNKQTKKTQVILVEKPNEQELLVTMSCVPRELDLITHLLKTGHENNSFLFLGARNSETVVSMFH
jgi:hypothetical protein